jgi:hypothetical protein
MSTEPRARAAFIRRIYLTAISLALLLLVVHPSLASAAEATTSVSLATLRVTSIDGELALGGRIKVRIPQLREYLKTWSADASKFVLYLDDRRIEGLTPMVVPGEDALNFDIRRTDASRDAWSLLLGSPPGLVRHVSVSVAFESSEPLGTDVREGNLLIVRSQQWPWIALVGVLLAAYWFYFTAKSTGIIRDPSPLPQAERPYSLARSQMAFWFFIVSAAFFGIWAITGAIPPLSDSALALTGISATTAIGARLVDKNNDRVLEKGNEALATARSSLRAADLGLPLPAGKNRANLTKTAGFRRTTAFWADLLSDANGYSFHRLQMVVWTMVLGIVFLSNVYQTLSMPEFPGTLLALMGISGGTYIGFKTQEQQS